MASIKDLTFSSIHFTVSVTHRQVQLHCRIPNCRGQLFKYNNYFFQKTKDFGNTNPTKILDAVRYSGRMCISSTTSDNHGDILVTSSSFFSSALSAAEICYKYDSYYEYYYTSYCSGYCAGSTFSEYCLYYYYNDGESGYVLYTNMI